MLKELVERIENAGTWDEVIDELNELAYNVDMIDEWENADGEDFEGVIYEMLEKVKAM